jgi:hypothetical protein
VNRLAAARRLSTARAVLGAGHLARPGWAARALTHRPMSRRARQVIWLLGVRQVIQAAATRARPTRCVLTAGAAVDGLHAISMLMLGVSRREWRGPALADATAAATLAGLGAAASRLSEPRSERG